MDFNFEDSLGYYLNRTASVMRSSLQRAFQKQYQEITVDYWVILNRLWRKDGMIQNELAGLTGKDNASMTRMLDGMQKKGMIIRKPDENDRRAFRIHLTKKGKSLEEPLKKIAWENTSIGIKNVSRDELESLKRILQDIWEKY